LTAEEEKVPLGADAGAAPGLAPSADVEPMPEARPQVEAPGFQGKGPPVRQWTVRRKQKKPRTVLGIVIEIVVIVAAAFAIATLLQAFLIKPFTIHQVSMKPTLLEGDRVLVNRLTYHFRDPKVGDVVVFHSPVDPDEDLVKRIVGVAEDRVGVKDGRLYVNGVALKEPELAEQDILGEFPEIVVPDRKVFVMGDNRNQSSDSRIFGPIGIDSIMGTVFAIYWPIGRWGGL
jgi:signal peptidase I